MVTNNPSDIFTEMDLKYIDSLDERKKHQYLATRVTSLGKHGVSLVSKAIGTDRKTIYRGIHELKSNESIPDDSIRREGGGRRRTIDMHPEYMDVFHEMVDNEIAGLPQEEDVRWLKSSPSQISDRFYEEYHIHVSVFIVKQLIAHDGYRYRKPLKSLPMRECKDRDKQFNHISELREQFQIQLSIDTKKKEQVGNFRRDNGRICSKEQIKTFDHDFGSFDGEPIIPHGILDVIRNIAYMAFGTSHDTAEFACNCIAEH